jgi:hypothetical protein
MCLRVFSLLLIDVNCISWRLLMPCCTTCFLARLSLLLVGTPLPALVPSQVPKHATRYYALLIYGHNGMLGLMSASVVPLLLHLMQAYVMLLPVLLGCVLL